MIGMTFKWPEWHPNYGMTLEWWDDIGMIGMTFKWPEWHPNDGMTLEWWNGIQMTGMTFKWWNIIQTHNPYEQRTRIITVESHLEVRAAKSINHGHLGRRQHLTFWCILSEMIIGALNETSLHFHWWLSTEETKNFNSYCHLHFHFHFSEMKYITHLTIEPSKQLELPLP